MLSLCENQWISAPGVQALAAALPFNHSLHTLFLDHNVQCGDEGAVAMAEALKANQALTNVTLGGNKIGDAGALAMADMLRINNALKRISLNENRIGEHGAFTIGQVVKKRQPPASLSVDLSGQETLPVPTSFPRPAPPVPLPRYMRRHL